MLNVKGFRIGAVSAILLTFSIWHSAVELPPEAAVFAWHLPRGLPVPKAPADNPVTQAKVDLGRRLFTFAPPPRH